MPRPWSSYTTAQRYTIPVLLATVIGYTVYFSTSFSSNFGSQIRERQDRLRGLGDRDSEKALREAREKAFLPKGGN